MGQNLAQAILEHLGFENAAVKDQMRRPGGVGRKKIRQVLCNGRIGFKWEANFTKARRRPARGLGRQIAHRKKSIHEQLLDRLLLQIHAHSSADEF